MKNRIIILIITFFAFAAAASAEDKLGPRYESTPSLPGATVGHTATVLPDGKVLVVGGLSKLFDLPFAVDMARIYDPALNKWQPAKGKLNQARLFHGAIPLDNGRVLIVGGLGPNSYAIDSLELYHPDSQTFAPAGKLTHPRGDVRLNRLPAGKVLVTGGSLPPEILQPDGDAFTSRPPIGLTRHRRDQHACVELTDGRILLIGGRTQVLEIFDPKTELFHACKPRLPSIIDDMAATLLYDGNVLIAGGQDVFTSKCIHQTWLYDPAADKLTAGPTLAPTAPAGPQPGVSDMCIVDLFAHDPQRAGRYFFLCGGEYDPGQTGDTHHDVVLNSAWLYNALEHRFINVGPMPHPHDDFAMTHLPPTKTHARALIIAGYTTNDEPQSNCEIFLWPK